MACLELTKNIPEWLDQQFFEKVLRQYKNDTDMQVVEFSMSPGLPAGINFGSAVFRVSIVYKSKSSQANSTLSAFIKTLPVGIDLSELEYLKDSKLFLGETNYYGNVLPEITKLLSSVGDNEILSPR
jgi:Ecdysteroid kinase-like family